MKDLEIGILVVNAGVACMGLFNDLYNQEVEDLLNVNATHVAFTIKVLLKQMLVRHEKTGLKAGILVTS